MPHRTARAHQEKPVLIVDDDSGGDADRSAVLVEAFHEWKWHQFTDQCKDCILLDRRHLALIREINRAGNVTTAADRLNLSQSAISHAIAKLEDRLPAEESHRR